MKVAIPVAEGKLCSHFGHCEKFAFVDLDMENQTILGREDMVPPAHAPGVIPPWVAQQGAEIVLAGGMGGMAIQIFESNGVRVQVGCASIEPEELVKQYMADSLEIGINSCNHDEEGSHECKH